MDLETQENQEIETPEISMDDTIRAKLEEITARGDMPEEAEAEAEKQARSRDEKGKFAKAEQPAEAAPEEEKPAEEQKPVKKAPSSWRKEAQERFNSLDPVAQDEILKREEDFHRGVEAYKTKAQVFDQLDKIVSPFAENYKADGKNAMQAIQELFAFDHGLRHGTQQQKIAVVSEIMRRAGLTPETIAQVPPADQNYMALEQRLNEVQSALRQRDEIAMQNQERTLHSEIQRWANGKEHFENVREDMAALLQAGRAQTLDEAYDMAVWANPTARAQLIAKQQEAAKAEAAKKAQEAKRAASVNVQRRGAVETTSKKVGTMEDTIRETMQRLGVL